MRAVGFISHSYEARRHLGDMLKTALSSAAGATQTATDVPAAGRVTFEIAVLLAVHLAIALAATVAVQSFAMF